MKRTTLVLLLLAAVAAAQDAKEPVKEPEKSAAGKKTADAKPDPTARFWEARRVMLAGKPKDAAELFRTLLSESPKADVADDCLYWSGRCYLRIDDREPDAVVAFKRLVETMPGSPFVDDAARELGRLGDRTLVPVLAKRLDGPATEAEAAARALAELGDARGVDWLAEKLGEKQKPAAVAPEKDGKGQPEPAVDELEELRAEVKRLRKELEESVKLLEGLLSEKAGAKKAAEEKAKASSQPGEEKKDETKDSESETKK